METGTRPLTPATIEAALSRARKSLQDEWLPDGSSRGEGRLFLRAQPTGARWYFRYTLRDGKRDTLAMGAYAASGRTKADATGARYSLAQARDKAREYGAYLKDPETANIRAHLDAIEQAAERARQAQRDAEEAVRRERESGSSTLADLCAVYAQHLETRGRVSASKVRADLERYVITGPKTQSENASLRQTRKRVAVMPARDVQRPDVAALIRAISEAGKPRAAGIVRSYLKAAYTLAIGAESDARAPSALLAFRIQSNPVTDIQPIPVDKRLRHLSPEELRFFLSRLAAEPDHVADALHFCLLAGGQRPQQMLRANVSDYRPDTGDLQLLDRKGKRTQPRVHILPLASRGRALAEQICSRAKALHEGLPAEGKPTLPLMFTTTGRVAVDVGTLSFRVTEISRAMVQAGEALEPFQMKDLRRTVETMMAALRISKDIRSQVLSHGLSGVQSSTYDRHDYADEKRSTLARWERRLVEIEQGTASKVVPIRAS